jgi:hypothetical protein
MPSAQPPNQNQSEDDDDIEAWEIDAAYDAIADYLNADGKIDFARLNEDSVDGHAVMAMFEETEDESAP